MRRPKNRGEMQSSILKIRVRSPESGVRFRRLRDPVRWMWIYRQKTVCVLAESTDGAFVPYIQWMVFSSDFMHTRGKTVCGFWAFFPVFTHKRPPMAAETMALLIARQVLGQFSPNRARSRQLRGRTLYASPTAFGAAISDIPPRHRGVVGVRGAGGAQLRSLSPPLICKAV